jgi:hypothetical protein
MRASMSRSLLSFALLSLAPACGDAGNGSTGLSAGPTTTAPGTTGGAGSTGGGTTAEATTEPGTGTTGGTTAPVTSSAGSTGTTAPGTGSTTSDPNCPPVKGEYNDCTDDKGKVDNTQCKWMGNGDNGFITCLNSGGMPGASTCSLVNCELDCHCFNQPATGTAKSICKPMATDKGDNACVLDCSGGATCPDGMACDNDTCFWPAP